MLKLVMVFMFSAISLCALDLSESLRLNGYANLYTLSSSEKSTNDSEKYLDTSGGIQARYQITDAMSATAQIYLHENDNNNRNDSYELEAKWLYADYYLGNDLTFRAGLFQFPIFKSAETGTIGYTRTWSETPLDSYGANGYEDFMGVEILKKYFYDDYKFLVQLSYGSSENELPTNKNGETVNGKTNSLVGITLKTTYDWLSLNVGYLQATSKVENLPSGPSGSISTQEVDFYMYALETQVDLSDWSLKAGYINVKLSDIFPDELKYYGSIEYAYKDLTPYLYYARENFSFQASSNPLDHLSKVTEKYSAGVRYDFNENTALKLSYTKKINTMIFTNSSEEQRENIYKAGINVMF